MPKRLVITKPVLRHDEETGHEHKTSWLELFYDLVFVAVVGQFSERFAEAPSVASAWINILFFLPILWSWIGFAFYNDRFETEDLTQRILTLLKMTTIIAIALFIQGGSPEDAAGVVLSYVAMRCVIVGLWLRAGWYNPEARPLTNRYAIGFTLSIGLWILSLLVPPPWRLPLRGLGFFIDLVTPMATLKAQSSLPKLTSSHFPERFGILILIVLGELVTNVIIGRSFDKGPVTNAAIAFGIVVAVGLWWLYFDQIMGQKLKPLMKWRALWVYLHVPLVLGIMAFGSGHVYLVHAADAAFDGTARLIFSASLAMVMAALALLQTAMPRDEPRTYCIAFCLIGAAGAVVVGIFAGDAPPAAFMAGLSGLLIPPLVATLF